MHGILFWKSTLEIECAVSLVYNGGHIRMRLLYTGRAPDKERDRAALKRNDKALIRQLQYAVRLLLLL